jgi:hypothetical protein
LVKALREVVVRVQPLKVLVVPEALQTVLALAAAAEAVATMVQQE